MPVNETIVETLSIENLKATAGFGAAMGNQMLSDAVVNARFMNGILGGALGKILKEMTETDVAESVGLATLAQVASKAAGNTPPVTP